MSSLRQERGSFTWRYNQSHAPRTTFQRTLVEQLPCPLFRWLRVLLTPAVPRWTMLSHCLAHISISVMPYPFTVSFNIVQPSALLLLWSFYLFMFWLCREKTSKENLLISQNKLIGVLSGGEPKGIGEFVKGPSGCLMRRLVLNRYCTFGFSEHCCGSQLHWWERWEWT